MVLLGVVIGVVAPAALRPDDIGAFPAARRTPAAASAPTSSSVEAGFVERINQLRRTRGLHPLTVDHELTAASRQWANVMADAGKIFHANDLSTGISAPWAKLGENVGVGNEEGRLFDAFVASPGHLRNLVETQFTHVGVGVVIRNGRIYTTHRFMALKQRAPAPKPAQPVHLPPVPTAPPPTAPPATAPPATAPPTTAAPTTTTTTTTTTTVPPTTTTQVPDPVGKLGPLSGLGTLFDA